ncbi:hypothetical protein ACIF6L_14260 [Kitasatospora sp. NPDC086009]|uniref:hypothetical protein n=1 Tax=unclassified Kitasatospora TaxID=2633591 RepID=UPI0037CBFF18
MKVPAAYGTTARWQLSAQQAVSYGVLPKAGLVVTLSGTDQTYLLTAREAGAGKVRWVSKPVKGLGEAYAPRLMVVSAGGKEFVVLWSTGKSGGDALTKAQQIYSIDVFAADGSGQDAVPAQHLEIPMPSGGRHEVLDGGGGKLLLDSVTDKVTVVDAATGAQQTVEPKSLTAPTGCLQCNGPVVAMTGKGPVVSNSLDATRFWSPAGWDNTTVAPPEADPAQAAVWPVAGGQLLARWQEKDQGSHNVWAVLDGESGQVKASVLCDKPLIGTGGAPASALSPNGRYLVSEHLAFDLTAKKGYCFEETKSSKPLTFTAVTDDGTAYGTSLTKDGGIDGSKAPVQLSLATGTAQALDGVDGVPVADLAGVGVFKVPSVSEGGLVAYPRKG